MTGVNIFYLLITFFLLGCSTNKKENVIKDFSNLSQIEKREVLPFMLDTLDHEMYGIGVIKTKEDIRGYGGLAGYYISHYPSYTSGGLVLPIVRVYDSKGKLVDSLIGGSVSKDNKSILNIGGFSKPFDFSKIRIHNEKVDKEDALIRQEILSGNSQNVTKTHYSSKFMEAIPEEDFVDLEKYQNALLGKGYDVDCIATAIRETEEETGIKLKKDAMILLDIHSSVLEQATKSNYTIKASSTGVCYFMFEMGAIHLKSSGKIGKILLNSDAIENVDEINLNISYDENNDITLKGFDDATSGIKFIKLKSVKKIFADNKIAYKYNSSNYGGKTFDIPLSIGDAFVLVPDNIKYKTCNPILFRTVGKFIPSKNSIGAQELISKYAPKTLCSIYHN